MTDAADDERHDATGAGSDGGDNQDDDDDGKANDPLTRTDAEASKVPFEGTADPEADSGNGLRGAPAGGTVQPLGLAATGWRGGRSSARPLISRLPSMAPPSTVGNRVEARSARPPGRAGPGAGAASELAALVTRMAVASPRQGHEQPEVVPHDGQAWQLPARTICTPHCMQ